MRRLPLFIAMFIPLCAPATDLAYLESADPYYVSRDFPRFTTPQWAGDPGVEAVLVLSIDDMRDHEKYEAYLRPILDRLKSIDGRAPVSIMTCEPNPDEPHLETWLNEGVSIDAHTIAHPCPLLGETSFAKSRATYNDCIDLLNRIPSNRPVAYRMPCCDSLNTPSPRFYSEIFNKTTDKGHYLSIDSSVFNITTAQDTDLPENITRDRDGADRFRKYLPFPSFVNTIEDYPYPYVIGRLCWEIPCTVPSDWEAQNINEPNNPKSVADMKAAIDAAVIKKGVYVLVFHPHGWIENTQVVELVSHAHETYGKRIRFMTFPEILGRIEQNALGGHSLRDAQGRDNGVRLLDVNCDGFQDVVIAHAGTRKTRIWAPDTNSWRETEFPAAIVSSGENGNADQGIRFGWLKSPERVFCVFRNENEQGAWIFNGTKWEAKPELLNGLGAEWFTARKGVDAGLRFHDINSDGQSELLVASPANSAVFQWDRNNETWVQMSFTLPDGATFVDDKGRDAGLRLADLNDDGGLDAVFSNERRFGVYAFESMASGWPEMIRGGLHENTAAKESVPPIAVNGSNRGAWFHSEHLWYQNEDTGELPDYVDRRAYDWLLNRAD